jgi:hypothetical protein
MKNLSFFILMTTSSIYSQYNPSFKEVLPESLNNVKKISYSSKMINSDGKIIEEEKNYLVLFVENNTDSLIQKTNEGYSIEVNRYTEKKELIESFEIINKQKVNHEIMKIDSLGNLFYEGEKWEIKVDSINNQIESKLISNRRRPTKIISKYSDQGKIIKEYIYKNNILTDYSEFDQKGKIVKWLYFTENFKTNIIDTLITFYEYDTLSRINSKKQYGFDGQLSNETIEEFDQYNKLIRLYEMKETSPYEQYEQSELTFSETGKSYTEKETNYIYLYDVYGNWIEKKYKDDKNRFYTIERKIEYKK